MHKLFIREPLNNLLLINDTNEIVHYYLNLFVLSSLDIVDKQNQKVTIKKSWLVTPIIKLLHYIQLPSTLSVTLRLTNNRYFE